MKVALAAILGLCTAPLALVHAQYMSEGWKPGQPVAQAAPTTSAGYDPSNPVRPTAAAAPPARGNGGAAAPAAQEGEEPGFVDRLITSGPVQALFSKAGVNITERYEEAKRAQAEMWDERIPIIDDENYEDTISNEVFATPEEEAKRVWFLIITAQSSGEAMSKYADKNFDEAFAIAYNNSDLPNVKWGRINYMNVTRLTTRWNIWSAPYLVVATDRAKTLRFFRASQLRMTPETLHAFLKQEYYLRTAPWASSIAPGGKNEWIMERLAIIADQIYTQISRIPRWLFITATGMFGSMVIQFFHRNDAKKAEELRRKQLAKQRALAARTAEAEKADDSAAKTTLAPAKTTATPTASPAKKRKGKK